MEGTSRLLDNKVLVRCCRESADVEVTKWFEEGKSIIFRGMSRSDILSEGDDGDKPWYLFTLPVHCLYNSYHIYQQQNQNISKKKGKDLLFNHSLRHMFPIPFELSYNIVHPQFAALYDASSVVLGSTVYFFSAHGRKIFYLEGDVADTTSSLNFKFAGRMISEMSAPKLVTLDGKIYVFGSKDLWVEVFEPRPHRYEGSSKKLYSPIPPSGASSVVFVVAIENEKKIIVGFNFELMDETLVEILYPDIETRGTAVFIYDVAGDTWVKHETNFPINHKSLLCEPIVVDFCLYWLDTNKMWAYDFISNQYFEGPIEDGLFRHVVDINSIACDKVSLLHLAGDVFYMIWADSFDQVLHFTRIHALKSNTNLHANRFKLRTTVSCCQTFDSRLSPTLRDGALILSHKH